MTSSPATDEEWTGEIECPLCGGEGITDYYVSGINARDGSLNEHWRTCSQCKGGGTAWAASVPATEEEIMEAPIECPFCNSMDSFVERADLSSAYVMCNHCGARGPIKCQESDDEETPGEANAIDAWNRRPPVASPAGRGDMNNGLAAGAAPRLDGQSLAPASGDAPQGHAAPCYYCGEPCDSYAGNPAKWPIPLCHADDPGVVKWHHTGCVSARLIENQPTSAWRDIASAPKDGTRILLGRAETEDSAEVVAEGYYWEAEPDGPDSMGHDGGFLDLGLQFFDLPRSFGNPAYRRDGRQPTHWHPLPAPPGEAVAEVAAEEQVRSPSSGEPVHSSSIRSEALEEALKPFAEIALYRDVRPDGPDMIDGPDLAITPTDVRRARDALTKLRGQK